MMRVELVKAVVHDNRWTLFIGNWPIHRGTDRECRNVLESIQRAKLVVVDPTKKGDNDGQT